MSKFETVSVEGDIPGIVKVTTRFRDSLNEHQPEQGRKHDIDKPDWTLLPIMRGIVPIIRVLEFGASKYGRDNWRTLPDARRRYLSAAFRHLAAVADGEWLDSESNLPHLAHSGCCILFLLWLGDGDEAQ